MTARNDSRVNGTDLARQIYDDLYKDIVSIETSQRRLHEIDQSLDVLGRNNGFQNLRDEVYSQNATEVLNQNVKGAADQYTEDLIERNYTPWRK